MQKKNKNCDTNSLGYLKTFDHILNISTFIKEVTISRLRKLNLPKKLLRIKKYKTNEENKHLKIEYKKSNFEEKYYITNHMEKEIGIYN